MRLRGNMRLLVLSQILLLFLMGCATQNTKQQFHAPTAAEQAQFKTTEAKLNALQNYVVDGKVAFSNKQKGGNASFKWHQQANKYTIELQTPLSSGVVKIVGEPNAVSLMQPDGKLAVSKTPEELLQKALGMQIPITGLLHWLKGIPAPGSAPSQMMFNQNGQLGQLEQAGWMIRYESYQNVGELTLPEKITLTNGSVNLKFLFKQWNI